MKELKDKLKKGEVGLYSAVIEIASKLEDLTEKVIELDQKIKKYYSSSTAKKKT